MMKLKTIDVVVVKRMKRAPKCYVEKGGSGAMFHLFGGGGPGCSSTCLKENGQPFFEM